MSRGSFLLINEQQVLKAEIIQPLKIVDCIYIFACSTYDGDRFREILPDSEITKQYRQYGIAPQMLSSIKNDFQSMSITFKFDESKTLQVKKHHDGYVQYRSKK